MKDQAIGIVDEPNKGDQPDKLDISRHAMALTHFIQKSDTPITIGIQGEWGSGKTSLLNSIWSKLDESNEYKQIWINSWENSLLCSPEEALLKIISEIIDNMLDSDIDVNRKDKIKKAATGLMKGALRIGVTTALGGKAGEVTELMTGVGWKSFVKSTYRQTTNNPELKGTTKGLSHKSYVEI
jgi:predicted KAP-like P-loop ATPase